MVGLGLASHRFLIIVAAGYLASIVAYPYLPGPAPGVARPLIAFLLPTTAALIYGLLRRVWDRDLVRDRDETFAPSYEAIVFAVVLFVIAIHLMVLAVLTGALAAQRVWLVRVHDCAVRAADGQSWQSTAADTTQPRARHPHTTNPRKSAVFGCRRTGLPVTWPSLSARCLWCQVCSCPNSQSSR